MDAKLDFEGQFGDKRLDKRAALLQQAFLQSRTSSVHATVQTEAEQKAIYRFLSNDKVTEDKLIASMQKRVGQLSAGRKVLVIQDTTDVDLSRHSKRLSPKGIGPIGDHYGVGFMMHSCLVLDAQTLTPLGFSFIDLFNREVNPQPFKERHAAINRRPIEEKESYRWIEGCKNSLACLTDAGHITVIEDREGDIYDQFAQLGSSKIDLVVRCRSNRLVNEKEKLFDVLSSQPVEGIYNLNIGGDSRRNQLKRTATIEVRYCSLQINRPSHSKSPVSQVKLQAIEAREVGYEGKDQVHWRLLCTGLVSGFEEALQVIEQYESRWFIEQVHRLLKNKGFKIEESELENGHSIRKLSLFLLINVLRVMQMMLAYDDEEGQLVSEVYEEDEIKCLEKLCEKYQTDTNKNPYKKQSLAWASWVIARLGGWKNAKKERPPGPITFKNGLDRFNGIFEGWKLANLE
jgi:hypothetical protein